METVLAMDSVVLEEVNVMAIALEEVTRRDGD